MTIPTSVAAAAEQEDVDVVGLSMHNGAHLTLAPAVVQALRERGLETPVIVGGIIPEVDIDRLYGAGVGAVLGPGASARQVVETVRSVTRSSGHR